MRENSNPRRLPSIAQRPGSGVPASNMNGYPGADQSYNAMHYDVGGGNSFVGHQPSLKELITLFNKHYLWILSSAAVFVGFAAIYCITADRLYSASTSVEIKGYAPVLANASVESLHRLDTRKEEYLRTTIAKLRRPGIADRVLSQEGMADELKKYFKASGGGLLSTVKKSVISGIRYAVGMAPVKEEEDPKIEDEHYKHSPKLLGSYLGLIDIDPITETSLVEIEAVTRSPGLSQKVANAHARGFIEDLQSERQDSMLANLQTLQTQGKELSEKLAAAEAELARYAEENKLIISSQDEGEDLSMKKVIALTEALAKATAERMKTENLLIEIKNSGPADATTLDDEAIRPLRLDLNQALAKYESLSKKVTDKYPGMIELKAEIDSLENSIKSSREQMFRGLEIDVKSKRAAEESILKQLEEEKGKGYETSKLLVRYNVLRKESDSLRQLYEAVLQQVQETQVMASTGASNIVISDYATRPVSPSFPRVKPIMVISLFVGLILGFMLAIAREILDNRINLPEDASNNYGLPLLGTVPPFNLPLMLDAPVDPDISQEKEKKQGFRDIGKLKQLPAAFTKKAADAFREKMKKNTSGEFEDGDESAVNGVYTGIETEDGDEKPVVLVRKRRGANTSGTPDMLVTVSSPHTVIAEALRTIRAGLLLSVVDDPSKVILITSAEQGEGKTTLTTNLAVSLAQADYKTLLIDTDLRQASVAAYFGEDPRRPGITECISSQAAYEDVVTETNVPNLSILTSGAEAPNPAELLGSKRMGALIERAQQEYDFVLIDSPPVLAVSDTLMMSQHVDSVILVARSQKTLKKSANEASQRLRRVNARLAGIVLNDFQDPDLYKVSGSYYYVQDSSVSNG